MTTEQLAVWFQDEAKFCGCGDPEAAASTLLDLLNAHPLYDHRGDVGDIRRESGAFYLLIYWIDGLGLTEHGTSIGGAWLTEKGEEIRDALRVERERDSFETLFEQRCVHGYLTANGDHDCFAADGVDE